MKQQVIKKITTNIYKRFPEVAGIRPKIRLQSSKQKTGNNNDRYLLTFHAKVRGPGGKAIPRQVRVVANTNGRFTKLRLHDSRENHSLSIKFGVCTMMKNTLRQLEITFWRIVIPLMSESTNLSRLIKSIRPESINDDLREVIKKGAIWAGAGWSLGLTIALFSSFLF